MAEASSDLSAPQGIAEVLSTLLGNIVANPIDSLVNANYIGVLFWAVLIGIGMRAAGEASKNMLNDVSKALQLLVLMYLCVKLLKEAKVVDLCVRKNWNI